MTNATHSPSSTALGRHYLFPLLAVTIWAGNTVVSKMAASAIAPMEIGFYRWLLAGLLLTPIVLPATLCNWHAIRPKLGRIVVLGLLGMVMYQTIAYYAAHMTTATNMGIINSLNPLMVLALAIPVLRQQITSGALAGCALSVTGVILVVTHGHPGALLAQGVGRGDALMLLAVLTYAAYAILLKRWDLRSIPALQLTYLQVLVAIVALFPLFLFSQRTGLNSHNIPLVLYAGVFASICAPWCWMRAVATLGPSRSSMCFNLIPLFTALIAARLLGEALATYHLTGGLLIIGGVILGEWWKTPLSTRGPVPCLRT